MISAQLQSGNTVQFTYETTGNSGAFDVGLYRSADTSFDASDVLYGTDVTAEQIAHLGRHANLHAVKESSGDVRRVTAIRERLDDRMQLFAGMDDMILESIPMGAQGWIAGLVNAFPVESVRIFDAGVAGKWPEARRIYEWFLPLLRLDTVPKFVQLIKLVQQEVGRGSEVVRPPRLVLTGAEREQTISLIRERVASRPAIK
jgi:4-hydroxy-tetrahydrodipicolinate synthase